jgi:hypothetical protein
MSHECPLFIPSLRKISSDAVAMILFVKEVPMNRAQFDLILRSGFFDDESLAEVLVEKGIDGMAIEITGQDGAYGWLITSVAVKDTSDLESTEDFQSILGAKSNMRSTLERMLN